MSSLSNPDGLTGEIQAPSPGVLHLVLLFHITLILMAEQLKL